MKPFCMENIAHENENLDKSDCFVLTILPVGILEQSSLIGNLILVRFPFLVTTSCLNLNSGIIYNWLETWVDDILHAAHTPLLFCFWISRILSSIKRSIFKCKFCVLYYFHDVKDDNRWPVWCILDHWWSAAPLNTIIYTLSYVELYLVAICTKYQD